tara:strand:+ start:4051 stop:5937 length:1887 start_codon:yes stop_codon:yes gene_type:complete
MGATYTRQSSYSDGDVITAAHTNDEFNQLLAAFQASTGHTHDGTANEGGPITKLLGNSITLGAGTAGTDITLTFDGETSDGVMYWMEDEDHFKFADDVVIDSTKKLYFYDEGGEYIYASADGQLDLVAGTEIQIAATTIDINGAVDISGNTTIGGSLIIGGSTLSSAELTFLDGVTAGTVSASKALVVDSDKDIASLRNITLTGELDAGSLDVSGDADIDGTLEADAITVDGVALATYIRDTVGTNMLSSNTESGITVTYDTSNDNIDFAIDAAQTGITSLLATDIKIGEDDETKIDFETADEIHFYANNVSLISLTNANSGDAVLTVPTADKNFTIKGTDGSSAVTALDIDMASSGDATFNNKVIAAELDISGDVDVDGTLEADAITVDGVALGTFIRDTVGTNMLSSNTESGITVTYDTSNDNIDFAIDAAQTGITSLLATDIKIGEDDQTKIDFETADEIHFYANNVSLISLTNENSGDAVLTVPTADKNFAIKGTDGSSGITALDIDMADSGKATFNGDVNVGGEVQTANIGYTDGDNAMSIADGGAVTFSQAPVFPDGSINIADLDIDGGTDIGADLTTSDLIVVDDGASGANRKAALSRLTTFMSGQGFSTDDPTALAIALG